MIFLYTNALTKDGAQKDPNLSIGGIVSSSVIPNDSLGNLFSDVSQLSLQDKKKETYVIALRNIFDYEVFDVSIEFSFDELDFIDYLVGVSTSYENECDGEYFEKLPNSYGTPYHTKLQKIVIGESIVIDSLKPNESIGIFVQKAIVGTVIKETCKEPKESYDQNLIDLENPEIESEFKIKVSWSLEDSTSNSDSNSDSNSNSNSNSNSGSGSASLGL